MKGLSPDRIKKNAEVDQDKKDGQDRISPCFIGAGGFRLFEAQNYNSQTGRSPEYDESKDNVFEQVLIGSG